MNPAIRNAAIRRSTVSNAVRSATRRDLAARQQAARQEAARQEAARQEAARREAARREAARREAARREAARQEAVRREAARRETARKLKQMANQRRSEALRKQQNAIREKANHARRVADGRAIPTRVRQVVNYGVGRNTAIHQKTHQINVIGGRFQQTNPAPVARSTNPAASSSNLKNTTNNPQQSKAPPSSSSKSLATKPLTDKEKAARDIAALRAKLNQKGKTVSTSSQKNISTKPLTDKEKATRDIAALRAKQNQSSQQKASSTQVARNARKTTTIVSTKSTKIATRSSTQIKSSVKVHKENVSKSKAKDKQVAERRRAASEKDSRLNKTPTQRVTRSATMNQKQAQPKIGGAKTAILHSFKNAVKAGGKGPETRRSSQRIAQQSGGHGGDDGYGSDGGGSGSDSDDERDTSLHPESQQSKDFESRFKWDKNKTEFQYQFRKVNSKFPANKDVMKEFNSPKVKGMSEDIDHTDCSEIAEKLYKASGKKGSIITIEPKVGRKVFAGESTQKSIRCEGYDYHTVFRDNHYVYDPRLSKNPIPRGDFQSIITKLNPHGVKVHEGHPWNSVKVHKRGDFVNKVGKI